jgi:hypothetical protein
LTNVEELAFNARRQVERLELRSRELAERLKEAEAAESLAQKQAFVAYVTRLAEEGIGKATRRVEISDELRALAVELTALSYLIREGNTVARAINAPKIPDPTSTINGNGAISIFQDSRMEIQVSARVKELRDAAAA